MTDIKSSIGVIKGLYHCRHELSANECVGRHCNQCECFSEKGKEDKSLKLAIRSLKAWEEVLNELEKQKDVYKLVPISSTAMGKAYTYDESTICMAIDIIKSKLEGVTEND